MTSATNHTQSRDHDHGPPPDKGNVPVSPARILSSLTSHLREAIARATDDDQVCVNLVFYSPRLHSTLHFLPLEMGGALRIDTGGYHAQLRKILNDNEDVHLCPEDINEILAYACASPLAVSAARPLIGFKDQWDSPQGVLEDLLHRFNSPEAEEVYELNDFLPLAVICLLSFLPQPRGLKKTILGDTEKHIDWIAPVRKKEQWKKAAGERSVPYKLYFLLSLVESLQWPEGASFVLVPNIHEYLRREARSTPPDDDLTLQSIRSQLNGSVASKDLLMAPIARLMNRANERLATSLAFHALSLRHCGLYFSYESPRPKNRIANDLRDTLPPALSQHAAELSQLANVIAIETAMPPVDTSNGGTLTASRFIARSLTNLLPATAVHILYLDGGQLRCEVSQRPDDDAVEKALDKDELPSFCLPTPEEPWATFSPATPGDTAEAGLADAPDTECRLSRAQGLLLGKYLLGENVAILVEPPSADPIWEELDGGKGLVYLGQFVSALLARVDLGAAAVQGDIEKVAANWYRTFSWSRYALFDAKRRYAISKTGDDKDDRRLQFYQTKIVSCMCGAAPASKLHIGDFGCGFSDVCQQLKDGPFHQSHFVGVSLGGVAAKASETCYDVVESWDWAKRTYSGTPLDVLFLGFGRFGVHWRQDARNTDMLLALLGLLNCSGLLVIEHMLPCPRAEAYELPLGGNAGDTVIEHWEKEVSDHRILWKARLQYSLSDGSEATEFCRFANYCEAWYKKTAGEDAIVTVHQDHDYDDRNSDQTLTVMMRKAERDEQTIRSVFPVLLPIVKSAKKDGWPENPSTPPSDDEVESWATSERLPSMRQIPTFCELNYLVSNDKIEDEELHKRTVLRIVSRWAQAMKEASQGED